MASVYRKTVTRRLPVSAELFTRKGKRFATWKDAKGRRQTALVIEGRDGSVRVRLESGTYLAKYRDGQGIVREVSTGCRSKDAALAVLKSLTDRAEKVKSGILTSAEDAIADHLHVPIGEHIEAYFTCHRNRGSSPTHLEGIKIRLDRLVREIPFCRLADIRADAVSRWIAARLMEGMAPRTRNSYLEVLKAFCNWCVQTDRLASNPLSKLRKADQQTDRRIVRRLMTENELRRLLYVATWRPLAEFGRQVVAKDPSERKAKRDTWTMAPLTFDDLLAAIERAREKLKDNPAFIAELERRGRQRALVYKALVLTGLRRGELASLTIGDLHLDGPVAHATLDAAAAKNRQATEIPLRDDLVADLRTWLAENLELVNGPTVTLAGPREAMPLDSPLFSVPRQLVKTLDRDLAAAGIPKADDRGRTLDV
ncbi:MAG TPA: tyrosine-type recombinase/integrase, partial [Lacipirellulaceae bacterium]